MSSAGGGGGVGGAHDPYAVLARGPFRPEEVVTRRVPRASERDARAEAVLARAWDEACESARRAGQRLFPGRIEGLTAFRAREGRLELDFHETDYREFVGTNLCPAYLALENAPRADALGISVVVVAGEHVILHRRGTACFEWPLAVDTPGGHVEPGKHEDPGGGPSPFRCALDELEGELGIVPSEVHELRALGLTRIRDTAKPQLVLAARVAVTAREIERRLATAREGFETSELLPVRLAEIAAIERERVTPAGRAGIRFAREMLSPG